MHRKLRTLMVPVMILSVAAALAPAADALAGAEMPAAGAAAPDFSLMNGDAKSMGLKDFRGKWTVLYFYPKDFTGGCTMEAHNFQRDLAKYEQAGAVIVGVSVDTPESHKSFCAKEGLNFTLLSDPDGKVSEQYGSVMEYN